MAAAGALFIAVPGVHAQSVPLQKFVRVRWQGLSDDHARRVLDAAMAARRLETLDPTQLDDLCQQLTQELREAGFLVAQVVATSQDLASWRGDGEHTLSVFEGKVGLIALHNSSRVADARLQRLASRALCPQGVGENCLLTAARLERAELLLQDVPGVRLDPVELSAQGVEVGQTAVGITTTPSAPVLGAYVGADSYGIASSGAERINVGATFTNLLHVGDVLQLSGMATNRHQYVGELQASAPLDSSGLRGVVGASHLLYALPQVGAHGNADTVSAGVAYPLRRGLEGNWTLSLDAMDSISRQYVAGSSAFEPRKIAAARLTLSGNAGDRPIQLGDSYWSSTLAWKYGHVTQGLQGATDASGQLGNFTKVNADLLGKLNIGRSNWYLLCNVRAQFASGNLDGSEKMPIGGQAGVRAYRADEGSLDTGLLASFEARRLFTLPNGDRVSIGPILDFGTGSINQHPYLGWQVMNGYADARLSNRRTVASWGIGADLVSSRGYSASVTWSTRMPGSADSVNYPGSARSRVLLSMSMKF